MCGRFSQTHFADELVSHFRLQATPDIQPRYNIAPSQPIPAIVAGKEGRYCIEPVWGLIPKWMKQIPDKPPINARAETVHEKPMFRDAFKKARCIIPCDGYYEWKAGPDGKKQPYRVTADNGSLFGLAGLWAQWSNPAYTEPRVTAVIVTQAATDRMAELHHRMPVLLSQDDYDTWLDTDADVSALLAPHDPFAVSIDPVSTAVNSPQNDDPSVLQPPQ